MSDYIVSARKYRPDSFDTLVGQENIARTLKNSIKRGQLAHAYLFCGPRGVGKTSTARIFAKTINCADPGPDMEPCGKCESCLSFAEGRSYCIHELDAASNNGVDDIKALIDQVRIPPQTGKYSVYIIDEVHMLSSSAFNAFLKTLEEPPAYAIFILATTEKHKILPTILSRCQTYDFNRISVEGIVGNLRSIAEKEGVKSFVYHSVLHSLLSDMPHHQKKQAVERALVDSGLPYVILQPAVFQQMFAPGLKSVKNGGPFLQKFYTSGETRMSFVDLRDYADAAAELVTSRRYWFGTYELCGEGTYSLNDLESLLSRLTGRSVTSAFIGDADFLAASHTEPGSYAGQTLLTMFHHYNQKGFCGNSFTLTQLLGRKPSTIEDYVREALLSV